MQDTIKIKAGTSGNKLEPREIAYHTEEKALYIGTAEGNVKLTFPPIESQASLSSNADIAAIRTAFNNLIKALKDSGIMKNT